MKSRKGALGGGLLYFVFFFMIMMIVAGIYGGLISFFGEGFDYRKTEADLILQEAKDCFIKEGFFDLTTSLNKNVFFDKCKMSSKVLEDGNHMIYMKNKNGIEFFVGVTDFKTRCSLNVKDRNRILPLCESFKSEDGNYLLVGSSQNSRRVVT